MIKTSRSVLLATLVLFIPQSVIADKPLEDAKQRLRNLVEKNKGAPVEQWRASIAAGASTLNQVAPNISREQVDAGGVPAEWIVPPNAGDRVLLYLHGGGYIMCSVETHRGLVARLARAARARASSVDYRLAPKHRFPAAVEDATAAYRWLITTGVKPAQVVIAGDSAGGGLTLATLVKLRDAGDQLPAAAVCISPWVDLEITGQSMSTKATADPFIQKDLAHFMARKYLGDTNPRTPLASPLYAELRGLPPLLIQVGTAETLLSDATRIAEKAAEADVSVTLDIWKDMIHGWHMYASFLPEGQQAIKSIGKFIRSHTP